jgi:hypothetical protein
MPATVTAGKAAVHTTTTITLSGHAATTSYNVQVLWRSGRTQTIPVTTDGSGAATVKVVPQMEDRGSFTINVIPAAAQAVAATTSGVSS